MHKKILVLFAVLILFLAAIKLAGSFPFIWQFFLQREINLKKEDSNINLLLLGVGGEGHEGPNLTDTIIFASLDEKNKKVTLVSIPRDLWISEIRAKINTAYTLGEEKKKGSGLLLAKAVVQRVIGQPIDYVVKIDFDGFVKAVDLLGGLDVAVERSFDDFSYPVEGKENDSCGKSDEELRALATASAELLYQELPCRYKHIHFERGLQHMDGKTALEFARSRHAQGEEGTDFARSRRQEKIIIAFKQKFFSTQTLLNPVKVLSIYNILQKNIETNIPQDEFDDFLRLAQKLKDAKIQSITIDTGDEKREGLLVNPPISEDFQFQWVLIPKAGNGNFSQIQEYVSCGIKKGPENCSSQNNNEILNSAKNLK
jgi:LCP family protein required for cell wall assembly